MSWTKAPEIENDERDMVFYSNSQHDKDSNQNMMGPELQNSVSF